MAQSSITAAFLRECFDYNPDTGEVIWRKRPSHHFPLRHHQRAWNFRWAGKPAGFTNKGTGYRHVRIDVDGPKVFLMHRLIWLMVSGDWPKNQIDHINRDRADNRLSNLRDVPRQENLKNRSQRARKQAK